MHVESENPSETKSYPAAREAALIQQVCQGDRDAFYALVQPYETVLVVSLFACANRISAGIGLVADF
jgi:hypothetical protein